MHTSMLPDPKLINTMSTQPILKLYSCLCPKPFQTKHIRLMQLTRRTNICHFQKENPINKHALPVQTLSNFPIEKLSGETVLVRFDANLLLEKLNSYDESSMLRAISTVKYLHNAKANVLIATNWNESEDPATSSQESLSDHLSSLLKLKVTPIHLNSKFNTKQPFIFLLQNLSNFSGEFANCPRFSEKLTENVSIFVNDAFSVSHRMLASTVGVAGFCRASLVGFNLEKEFTDLIRLVDVTTPLYFAIIGGNNFSKKAPALRLLASKCDGLIFIGKLAFQIMNGLDLPVLPHFLEKNAINEVKKVIKIARKRGIPILYPTDLVCVESGNYKVSKIFGSDEISAGWNPVNIGPKSLEKISCVVSSCQKILWIGSPDLNLAKEDSSGALQLAAALKNSTKNGCEIYISGGAACKAMQKITKSSSQIRFLKNSTVVWEYLKGRRLPSISALDKAYPYTVRWDDVFSDPSLPLIVDIGSGNGLFLFQMARKVKDKNFLGLEMNKKLVSRCLNGVRLSEANNLHFISTDATSNFGPIISSYPGNLILVTIQCPNPDFNRDMYRWKMVQRILVEAIIDLLAINGKVFLQSDIEAVTIGMKEQFISYGGGKMVNDVNGGEEWMEENPFGVRTDWELHTLSRGKSMYRIMLRKTG